jgi:hypothetical protein
VIAVWVGDVVRVNSGLPDEENDEDVEVDSIYGF